MSLIDAWIAHTIDAKLAADRTTTALQCEIAQLRTMSVERLTARVAELEQELHAIEAQSTTLQGTWHTQAVVPARNLRAACEARIEALRALEDAPAWVDAIEAWHDAQGVAFSVRHDLQDRVHTIGLAQDMWHQHVLPCLEPSGAGDTTASVDTTSTATRIEEARERLTARIEEHEDMLGRFGQDMRRVSEIATLDVAHTVRGLVDQLEQRLAPLAVSAHVESVMLERL